MKCLRCAYFAVLLALLMVGGGKAFASVTDPEFPLPIEKGDITFTQSGVSGNGSIARAEGKDFSFTVDCNASQTTLYWGSEAAGIKESFDNSTFSGAETFTFSSTLSNLAGGVAVWTGATFNPANTAQTIYPRFTMRATNQAGGAAVPLINATTLGLPESAGGVVALTAGAAVKVNLLFEASYNQRTGFSPALAFFDAIPMKSPTARAQTSFSAGFYSEVQNTPPTISDIGNQRANPGTATSAIPFTVTDAETSADTLTVVGTSSNQTLVPDASIKIGGSGA